MFIPSLQVASALVSSDLADDGKRDFFIAGSHPLALFQAPPLHPSMPRLSIADFESHGAWSLGGGGPESSCRTCSLAVHRHPSFAWGPARRGPTFAARAAGTGGAALALAGRAAISSTEISVWHLGTPDCERDLLGAGMGASHDLSWIEAKCAVGCEVCSIGRWSVRKRGLGWRVDEGPLLIPLPLRGPPSKRPRSLGRLGPQMSPRGHPLTYRATPAGKARAPCDPAEMSRGCSRRDVRAEAADRAGDPPLNGLGAIDC